jgi:hypothetical protein
MHAGWIGPERERGGVPHIDLRDGKVWIEHSGTEHPIIAGRFVESGIPRDRIVPGLRPPGARALTGSRPPDQRHRRATFHQSIGSP